MAVEEGNTMAMGRKELEVQSSMWVAAAQLPTGGGHPFYDKLNGILAYHTFDSFVEERCAKFYAQNIGRPSIPPVVYFKMLFIGYYEGIDSERSIAWRVADSLTLRHFLGYELTESTPDHCSLSRTRHRIDLETHAEIFQWVVTTLALEGLIVGKTIGVDATTLEANAALRTIVKRDTDETYHEFLTGLARESGIETPTRTDLARLDRKRPKKGSNQDWTHPHDPDARITKMKDGRTHLAHKAEHAVDMETGAIVALTLQPADQGDTTTIGQTLEEARENLEEAAKEPDAQRTLHDTPLREIVADKGYHSNGVMHQYNTNATRTYISEPGRGRRNWHDKPDEQQAVYANRRRIRGKRGKALMRKRGELIERSFAHVYDTGGMRRTHLKHRDNILKRLLVHAGAFNLSLILRKNFGAGTPKQLNDLVQEALNGLRCVIEHIFIAMMPLRHAPEHSSPPDFPDFRTQAT
jgi:transposase